jgi:hypothetical protein
MEIWGKIKSYFKSETPTKKEIDTGNSYLNPGSLALGGLGACALLLGGFPIVLVGLGAAAGLGYYLDREKKQIEGAYEGKRKME